jgi:hypothetical protein
MRRQADKAVGMNWAQSLSVHVFQLYLQFFDWAAPRIHESLMPSFSRQVVQNEPGAVRNRSTWNMAKVVGFFDWKKTFPWSKLITINSALNISVTVKK